MISRFLIFIFFCSALLQASDHRKSIFTHPNDNPYFIVAKNRFIESQRLNCALKRRTYPQGTHSKMRLRKRIGIKERAQLLANLKHEAHQVKIHHIANELVLYLSEEGFGGMHVEIKQQYDQDVAILDTHNAPILKIEQLKCRAHQLLAAKRKKRNR